MSSSDPPPRKPRGPWTFAALSVAAFRVATALVALAALVAGTLLVVEWSRPRRPASHQWCADRLRQLGAIYVAETTEHPGPPPYSGAALFLHYRKDGYIERGQEQVLACPGDPIVRLPESESQAAAYESLDLTDPVVARLHCSFAVRDFARCPLDPESEGPEIIACDAGDAGGVVSNHAYGLNVLYSDGSVRFRDREYLGLAAHEPLVVGPRSPVPLLRMVMAPREAALESALDAPVGPDAPPPSTRSRTRGPASWLAAALLVFAALAVRLVLRPVRLPLHAGWIFAAALIWAAALALGGAAVLMRVPRIS